MAWFKRRNHTALVLEGIQKALENLQTTTSERAAEVGGDVEERLSKLERQFFELEADCLRHLKKASARMRRAARTDPDLSDDEEPEGTPEEFEQLHLGLNGEAQGEDVDQVVTLDQVRSYMRG